MGVIHQLIARGPHLVGRCKMPGFQTDFDIFGWPLRRQPIAGPLVLSHGNAETGDLFHL